MKRKYSEINNGISIERPKYIMCDICTNRVYNYQLCTQPFTYCSIDCLEILILQQKNGMLHENCKDFKMKRVDAKDDLMKLE